MVAANYALRTDAATALAWARALPGEEANLAAAAVGGAAAADLGVLLATGQDGYPYVQNSVADYRVTQAGPLHSMDRIIGISQKDGSFVNVQHMDLLQVAGLLHGPAGALVPLQTAPYLGGGKYGVVTIVQVTSPPTGKGP